jgi:nucleoside-diphosphate kinase
MVVQQCLVIIKPDGIIKSLTGNIISALSETKLKIVGAKMVKVSEKREHLEKHYADLKARKPKIFEDTIQYMTGKFHANRVMALVYEGEEAITKIREICGATNPEEAHPVSIRGKYGRINSKTGVFENVVHASDSPETAEIEIKHWFSPEELTDLIYPTIKKKSSSEKLEWK